MANGDGTQGPYGKDGVSSIQLLREILEVKKTVAVIEERQNTTLALEARIEKMDVRLDRYGERLDRLETAVRPLTERVKRDGTVRQELSTGIKVAIVSAVLFMAFSSIIAPIILRAMGFH